LTDAVEVRVGESFACARRRSGAVACWGRNDEGQLGDGTNIDTFQPVTVSGLEDATRIGVIDSMACAIRSSGGVVCWGGNIAGKAGPRVAATPIAIPNSSDAVEIAGTCLVDADRTVSCFGQAVNRADEYSPTFDASSIRPRPIHGLGRVVSLTARSYSCVGAIEESGAVRCFPAEETGYGSEPRRLEQTAGALAALGEMVCGRVEGGVRCRPSGADSSIGVVFPGAVEVSMSSQAVCARDAQGRVFCAESSRTDVDHRLRPPREITSAPR
jgi:hypothetical protein